MNIIVNSKSFKMNNNPYQNRYKISYETVVSLAGYDPQRVLTVTWSTQHNQGSLMPGGECMAESGMIFYVANTTNA